MKVVVLFQDTATIKKFYGEEYSAMEETREDLETVEGLKEAGHEAIPVMLDQIFSLPECDIVFNLCDEFEDKRAAKVPKILENLGIKYTGAGFELLKISYGKKRIMGVLKAHKIPVPNYFIAEVGKTNLKELIAKHKMNFPLIIKPVDQDGGFGIDMDSVVNDYESLVKKAKSVYKMFKQDIVIEEYIDGREFSVPMLGNDGPVILPIIEMIFKNPAKPKVMTYSAKWEPDHEDYKNTTSEIPAKIDKELETQIKDMALKCWKAFECNGYVRIDFRVDANGKIYVLELNANPSLLKNSEFVYSAKAHGWSYAQLLGQIAKFGLERPAPKEKL